MSLIAFIVSIARFVSPKKPTCKRCGGDDLVPLDSERARAVLSQPPAAAISAPGAAVFCRHCGAKLRDDSRFCESCGKGRD